MRLTFTRPASERPGKVPHSFSVILRDDGFRFFVEGYTGEAKNIDPEWFDMLMSYKHFMYGGIWQSLLAHGGVEIHDGDDAAAETDWRSVDCHSNV